VIKKLTPGCFRGATVGGKEDKNVDEGKAVAGGWGRAREATKEEEEAERKETAPDSARH
jgi:hypothetical protein